MITLEKTELLKALRAVMPGVEKGSCEIEGADTILFKDNKIQTYNGMVAVSKKLECDNYTFAVKAVDLYNLINKMKEAAVNLDVDSVANKLKISSGKTKASLALQGTESIEKYTSKIKEGDLRDLPTDFADALKIVPISNNANPDLQGVAVIPTGDVSTMISTDRQRISSKKLSSKIEEMLVDDELLLQAIKVGNPKKYSITGPWLNFVYEDGTRFSCTRKDHTSYPGAKILPALDKFNEMTAVVSGKLPKDIVETVARVNVLSGIAEQNSEHIVKLTFDKSGISVYAENAGGNAEESIDWDTTMNIPEDLKSEIWVASSFITEAVNKSMDFKLIDRGSGNLAFMFTGDGYVCMVTSLKKS